MDAETKALLLKYLEAGADRLERGAAFVESEIPLVVQEYLSWYWWGTIACIAGYLIITMLCLVAGYFVPYTFRKAQAIAEWTAEITTVGLIQASVASALLLMSIGGLGHSVADLVKVSVAPRVVILEKIAEVAK